MRCKNCNKLLEKADNYCPNCGQKNIPVLNLKFVLGEFFQTIWNVDSKLFRTLKCLIFKPGYLTKEYISGKRVSYLPPIRIYLVLSFLFFFLISVFDFEDEIGEDPFISFNNSEAKDNRLDSNHIEGVTFTLNGENEVISTEDLKRMQYEGELDKGLDSLTAEMPKFAGYVSKKLAMAELNDEGFIDVIRDQFSLFLLLFLPFFSLLYATVFRKSRRGFIGHLIFNLHLNSFLIFVLLLDFFFGSLIGNDEAVNYAWAAFLIIVSQFYLIKAVMYFYNRKWGEALYKYLLLLIGYGVLAILFFILVFFSSIMML